MHLIDGDKEKWLYYFTICYLKFKWNGTIQFNDQIAYLLCLVYYKNLINSSSMYVIYYYFDFIKTKDY